MRTGSSDFWQIPTIVDMIVRDSPRTVADFGCGHGKYGHLCREYLDGRLERIDSFDADSVRGAEKLNLVSLPDRRPGLVYDLGLMIDVIEHLDKADGYMVVNAMLFGGWCRRVLISTPLGFREQHVEGHHLEEHRSGWWPWNFRRYHWHQFRLFSSHKTRHLKLPSHPGFAVVISGGDPWNRF